VSVGSNELPQFEFVLQAKKTDTTQERFTHSFKFRKLQSIVLQIGALELIR